MFAFREQDQDYFFGRETFVEGLVAVVYKQPLVAIIGASGSGKSSVVFAGLIPQLRKEGNWLIEGFRPQSQPFFGLALAWVRLLKPELDEIQQPGRAAELAADFNQGLTLTEVINSIFQRHPGKRILLVIDQFEELYTLCRDTQEQQRFIDELLAAVESVPRRLTLVLTLRADFFSYVLDYSPFGEALGQHPLQLLRGMKREEMQAAIECPAKKRAVELEEGLTERILDDVKQEPGNLPLLEFALTQLWVKQSRAKLTHEAYAEIGGVVKALALHAEAVYERLSDVEQKQTQRIFLQLVSPGEGTEDTRRVATRGEVENWELVTRLADARLVVTGRDEHRKAETVEVVHEALIREWGRLQGWMADNRNFRTWQERLRGAMRQWKATGKDDGALLRGLPLAEAEEWQGKRLDELGLFEQEFIQRSLDLREREKLEQERQQQRELSLERKARHRLQGLIAVSSAIALLSTGILTYSRILRWQVAQLGKMISIPAGDVVIDTNNSPSSAVKKHKQQIPVPAFYIEKYEVSNRQYHGCVSAGGCLPPIGETSLFYDARMLDHPVVGVTAIQASTYCRWLGRRLLTELEWERAARGSDGRLWPWGNQTLTPERANIMFDEKPKGTVAIKSYRAGGSKEGVFNLIGNVWEWTTSYYQEYENYDQMLIWDGDAKDLRPDYGLALRGGGWEDSMQNLAQRQAVLPSQISGSIGFRCASN